MRWPWNRETRQENYTDAVVAAILAAAGNQVVEGLTAGVETSAGWWGRGFSSAQLLPAGAVADMITPWLAFIGRSLVLKGEAVFALDTDTELTMIPASTVTVSGGANPREWLYELTLSGPSEIVTRTLPPDRVLHLTYAVAAGAPWRGVSPIEQSGTTKKLLANLEQRLAEEVGGSVGFTIPVPNVESTSKLQADIKRLKGETVLVETTSGAWGAGQSGAPNTDFTPKRIGANPPDVLRNLRKESEDSILAASGIPISALRGGDGSGARESFRQFLHLTIAPVALTLANVIADKFDVPDFAFDFNRLMASDLQGRARALASMVNAGMDLDQAARIAMLLDTP